MTKRLRVICNAWHFHCALNLMVKVVYCDIWVALLTP
ncbi:DUF3265 domain-containing protein [Vibrio parahaemolyticus]|nr:DUF3265 domain-containing protein [Vibrio parahaemolyticus]